MTRKQALHCLGDSHTVVFDYIAEQHLMKNTEIHWRSVPGATAQGMVNPNSKTDALNIMRATLQEIPKEDWLLLMLGEVDCGFVIWYRAEKYGIAVDEQLEISLTNYFRFLREVEAQGFTNLLLCTAHPPTIQDGQDWGEVANKRREVKASLRERTDLTFRYNERIREFCRESGYRLIDIEQDVIDPQTRLVAERFLNKDPLDHHLESAQIAPLYLQQLQRLGLE